MTNRKGSASSTILVVDDEKAIRKALREILHFEGYSVIEAADGAEAMKQIKDSSPDCILCDIKMPRMDGLEVLEQVQLHHADIPFILISGHGTIETAVEAVKNGAFDYVSKPPDLNRLLITLRNAMDKKTLVTETRQLRKKISRSMDMIGESDSLISIEETIQKVAPTEARVLITGENGVGKELVARRIHAFSHRSTGPLIEVNCAAIPSELIESELFGHEKGSFTSAIKQRIGKFEQANGGTLFLDEIGDLSMEAQAKMLRVLQEGRITRIGGEKEFSVNVRIVAATNKNLLAEVEKGRFRLDLYHRLSVILIHVPSLRERREDIPLLVEHFIEEVSEAYQQPPKPIEASAMEALKKLPWTGNIRELRNVVERLIILSGKKITCKDVRTYILP